jgi:glycosyltransferase involved in cell wall biosynthesis
MRLMRTLRWVLPNIGLSGQPPTSVAPPTVGTDTPDFLVWSVIDWHYRFQRPQHLARELARTGGRVFYISCNLIDDREPGFRVEPLDTEGRLYQVFFHVRGAPLIYFEAPSDAAKFQLTEGIAALLDWAGAGDPISLVEHPFWFETARAVPGGRLLYDRMDYHEGFGTLSGELEADEKALMRGADLTIVSSAWLEQDTAHYTDRRLLLRNAGEYAHFAQPPENPFRDQAGRKVIGYFGAIADWMDLDLVAAIARRFADCLVLLIGHDQCQAARKLARYDNVSMPGEVSYAELPGYLYGFDVCILPFRVIPLTLATNPVKIYEYLGAGKPVVAVELPEMEQFGDLISVADDETGFLGAIASDLEEPSDSEEIGRRRAFAAQQTWAHRAKILNKALGIQRT